MSNCPWIDEYNPKTLEDVSMSIETRLLINSISLTHPKNIIFAGYPGTGKSITSKLLAEKILQGNSNNLMINNPYENLGFKAITEKVMRFVNRASKFPLKVVIFEIMEAYQKKTQEQISSIINTYSDKVFFFFTCLETSNIIDNINSKCISIYFNPKPPSEIKSWCRMILNDKKKHFTEEGLNIIIYSSEGDLRKAINSIQVCINFADEVTEEKAIEICDLPNPKEISNILKLCKVDTLKSIERINEIIGQGYSVADIVKAFIMVISIAKIEEMRRFMLLKVVANTQLSVSRELVTNIQLHNMMFQLHKTMNIKEETLFD